LPDYTVAVLEDSLRVLELLKDHDDGMTLAELTRSSDLVKNKVFRILFTLEKHGFVERDEAGHFYLGIRFLEFAQHVQTQTTLLEAARPPMDRLVEDTSESIFLGVISGIDALCVAARESPRSVRLFAEVGRRAPLGYGGVPKVLLAFMPEHERIALLDKVEALDPAARQALETRLCQIREQGFAVVEDELDPGAHSIAAPIRDHRGHVIAAISIAGPSHRFSEECVARYIQLVLHASSQISQALGYNALQPGDNGYNK
jgi:DNA-binding IclR family transcriptional regulator